ncbi:MAG: hypothetical protein ACC654_10265, partial [Acidimicrobiia bacterium]
MVALVPRVAVTVVFLFVVSACASVGDRDSPRSGSTTATTTTPTATPSIDATEVFGSAPGGDGILDCAPGQVVRAADVDVSAATRILVAAQALEEWTTRGAILWDLPSLELWSAVLDGEDVAIAFPELNGDGTWVVHDVQTCGEPESGPAGIDGELDCATDSSWVMQGSIDPTIPGLPSAEEAVRSSLDWYAERYGGDIVVVSDGVGSL